MKQKKNLTRILCIAILSIFTVFAGYASAQTQTVTAQYTTTSDYGSGFTGEIKISNNGSQAINGWTLEFDFNRNFSSIFDAVVMSHVGNHYTVRNLSYNSTIQAGGSVTFGFVASPGNLTNSPTGYILNGASITRTATTFSYQGRLNDTSATANGSYDLQFALYDEGGTQIGTSQTLENVNVVNGIFNVQLDFGETAFSGANRVLEIRVRRGNETDAFTTLTPRQPVTPAPYSIRSLSASTATTATTATNFSGSLTGDVGGTQTATVIQPNSVTAAKIASNQVVKSVNGLKDSVTIIGGSGINVTPSGNNLTLSLTTTPLRKYYFGFATSNSGNIDINHNLGTKEVIVRVYKQNGVFLDELWIATSLNGEGFIRILNDNTVRVGVLSAGTYYVVIIG